MSGSGNSYLGSSTPNSSCESLQFETQLASPNSSVVPHLSVGDILDVIFGAAGQQFIVAAYNAMEAGSIVHPMLTQLRTCMNRGELYQARVLQVNNGQVRLRVYHV